MDVSLSEEHIARLVLAYLKEQNCQSAYHKFLNSSKHLKKYVNNTKNIRTRFLGENLVGILQDYVSSYTLVQERIEHTEYFEESNPSLKLATQLTYLLEKYFIDGGNSPVYESRCSTPLRGRDSVFNFPINRSTNATSLKSLPGNIIQETPKKSVDGPSHKLSNVQEEAESEGVTDNEAPDVADKDTSALAVQAFVQKLLSHQELQEKIAENINTARHSEGNDQDVFYQGLQEIDGAIKTVLEKTHSDPVFETLMTDIIGSVVSEPQEENHQSEENNCILPPQENKEVKQEPKETNHENQQKTLSTTNAQPPDFFSPNQLLSVNTGGEFIVLDQQRNMESPIMHYANTTSATPNLLMMKPQAESTQTNTPIPNYWLISTPQQVMQTIPQQYVFNNVITEQDIMKMPTIIIGEEDKENPKKVQPIVSKSAEQKTSALSEFITLYKANESIDSPETPELEPPERKRPATRSVTKKANIKKSQKKTKSVKTVINIELVDESKNELNEDIKKSRDDVNSSQERAKANKTPDDAVAVTSQTPSSSRSHVRALDFNFPSPPKRDIQKVSPKTKKSSKALFESPTKSNSKSQIEDKKSDIKSKSWDSDLRALAAAEAKLSTTKSVVKKGKKRLNRSADSEKKKKKIKVDDEVKADGEEIKDNPKNDENSKEIKSEVAKNLSEISKETGSEEKLINCNAKPCYKMKCNIENYTKTEVKVAKAKELKVHDLPLDSSDKLILSPSKLNANKRSLVSMSEQINLNESLTESSNLKRAIPLLETPIKESSIKTPGFFSPINTNDTPFTKTIKEHLCGVDISTIPTPKFPITPLFPFTPLIEGQSPHSNRPTDYSTSSSYYQPSDGEQNKSLEQILAEETKMLEKKNTSVYESSSIPNEEIEVASETKVNIYNPTFAEKIKSVKSNVIGKKNLMLLKKDDESLSSEESDSESSSDDSSFSSWNESKVRDLSLTPEEKQTRYPLRSNKNNQQESERKDNIIEDPIKCIVSDIKYKPDLVEKNISKELSGQEKILLEMEEKRKRTLSKLIDEDEKVKVKPKTNTINKNATSKKIEIGDKEIIKIAKTEISQLDEKIEEKSSEPKSEISGNVIQINATRRLRCRSKVVKNPSKIVENKNSTKKPEVSDVKKSEVDHKNKNNDGFKCVTKIDKIQNKSSQDEKIVLDHTATNKLSKIGNQESMSIKNIDSPNQLNSKPSDKPEIKKKHLQIDIADTELVSTSVADKITTENEKIHKSPTAQCIEGKEESISSSPFTDIKTKNPASNKSSLKQSKSLNRSKGKKNNIKQNVDKHKNQEELKDSLNIRSNIDEIKSDSNSKKTEELPPKIVDLKTVPNKIDDQSTSKKSNSDISKGRDVNLKKTEVNSNVDLIKDILDPNKNDFISAKLGTFDSIMSSLDSKTENLHLKKKHLDLRKLNTETLNSDLDAKKVKLNKRTKEKDLSKETSSEKIIKENESKRQIKLDKKLSKTFEKFKNEIKSRRSNKSSTGNQFNDPPSKNTTDNDQKLVKTDDFPPYPPHAKQIVTCMKEWGFPLIPTQYIQMEETRESDDFVDENSSDSDFDELGPLINIKNNNEKNPIRQPKNQSAVAEAEHSCLTKTKNENAPETKNMSQKGSESKLDSSLEGGVNNLFKDESKKGRKPKPVDASLKLNYKIPKRSKMECDTFEVAKVEEKQVQTKSHPKNKCKVGEIENTQNSATIVKETLNLKIPRNEDNNKEINLKEKKNSKIGKSEVKTEFIKVDSLKFNKSEDELHKTKCKKDNYLKSELTSLKKNMSHQDLKIQKSTKSQSKLRKTLKPEDTSVVRETHEGTTMLQKAPFKSKSMKEISFQNESKADGNLEDVSNKDIAKPNATDSLFLKKLTKKIEESKIEFEISDDEETKLSIKEKSKDHKKQQKSKDPIICAQNTTNFSLDNRSSPIRPTECSSDKKELVNNINTPSSPIAISDSQDEDWKESIIEFDDKCYTDFTSSIYYDETFDIGDKSYDISLLSKKLAVNMNGLGTDVVLSACEFSTLIDIQSMEEPNTPKRTITILENLLIQPNKTIKPLQSKEKSTKVENPPVEYLSENKAGEESRRVLRSSERRKTMNENNLKLVDDTQNKNEGQGFGDDEDLMNVAIGMDTIISGVKRKNEEEDIKIFKRLKSDSDSQKLLKTVDVEDFLKKIHGEDA